MPVPSPDQLAQVVACLRRSGARFAFVHGSAAGPAAPARPPRDIDVAGWWGGGPPAAFEVHLPDGVDLLVLDAAPLELAGRIALHGRLLFDDGPPARVAWQARTRLVFLDEQDRQSALDRVFLTARRGG
ncbi:MAG TPA: nucleotidyltransferase domain-containing protein [Candidatus Micrarchaeia archaeon]|nr:nucleotidyltransferase domain-containing protein [Candidatus Micrarchaeia archaeon]